MCNSFKTLITVICYTFESLKAFQLDLLSNICFLIEFRFFYVFLLKKKKDSIIYLNPPLEYSHITFYLNFRINSSIYEYKHNKCLLITTTIINFIFKTKIQNIYIYIYCINVLCIAQVILVFKKITFISHSFKGTAWQQNPNIFYFFIFLQIKKYKEKKNAMRLQHHFLASG